MKKKRLFGQKGFTLAEVVISAALIGVLAVAITSQMHLVKNTKRDFNENAIMNYLTDRVAVELSNQATCASASLNKNLYHVTVPTASTPTPIGAIYGANNVAIISNGGSYGASNGTAGSSAANVDFIKVTNIELQKGSTSNEVNLVISFQKRLKNTAASLVSKRTLAINYFANYTTPTQIESCFNDITTSITSAIRLSCQGNTSVFIEPSVDPPYGRCDTKNTEQACGNGQFITKLEVDSTTNQLKATCSSLVQLCPTNSNKVVTGFNTDGTVTCDYPFQMCAANQILVKSSATGRYACAATNSGCGAGYALRGFNTDGSINCQPYYPTGSCGGGYVTGISGTSVSCGGGYVQQVTCPQGQYIYKFDSTGKAICKSYYVPKTCPGGQGAYGFDSSGNLLCRTLVRRLSCNGSYSPGGKLFTDCPGTVMNRDGGTNSYCRMSGSSCPAGFTPCLSWGNSSGTVGCTDTNSACSYSVQNRYASGTGVFQNPVSGAQRTAQCYYWARNSGPWVKSCTQYGGPTATTPVTEVGCY